MLICSLKDLAYHQLVERHERATKPVQVTYTLTAYGQTVLPLLRALFAWGESHLEAHGNLIFH